MADSKSPTDQPRSWRGETKPGKLPPKVARAQKNKKIFGLLALMLAIVGTVTAIVLLIRPFQKPALVPIVITEYRDPRVPVLFQADRDRETLQRGNFFPDKAFAAFTSQEKDKLEAALNGLREAQDDSVVIYVCARALCDPAGEVCLLPGDADVDKPATWLKLAQVLEYLKLCPKKQKLLVLDTFRPADDLRVGVLANDLGERVKATLDLVKDDDRLTLCACGPGQVSLVAEELNQSVFGYYLAEGMRGWADGYNLKKVLDKRISVKELADYVSARVDRWATQNRGSRDTPARQTPYLHCTRAEGEKIPDFDLVSIQERPNHNPPPAPAAPVVAAGEPPPPPPPPFEPYPDWLRKLWDLRDQWWADQSYRLAPRVHRQLEARLLRAEQRWRAGVDGQKIKDDLSKDVAELQAKMDRIRKSFVRPEPRSIALAIALGKKPDPKVADDLKKLLKDTDDLAKVIFKPEEIAAKEAEYKQKFLESLKGKPPLDLAAAVWDRLGEETPVKLERVRQLNELLRYQQPVPLYVETMFLRRLDDLAQQAKADPTLWTEAVTRGIQVIRDGEAAAACYARRAAVCEPRAYAWLHDQLDQAAQKRHDAELYLFSPGYAPHADAVLLFADAAARYGVINAQLEVLEEAYRLNDEAMVRLGGLVPYFMRRTQLEPTEDQNWKFASSGLKELQDRLARSPAADQPAPPAEQLVGIMDDLQKKSMDLQMYLDRLTRQYILGKTKPDDFPLIKATRSEGAGPKEAEDLDDALTIAWISGPDRAALWAARRTLVKALNDKTRARDADDDLKVAQTPAQFAFDAPKAQRAEQFLAQRRAQLVLDLFDLGTVTDTDSVRQAVQAIFPASGRETKPDAGTPPTLPQLANELRLVWSEKMPKQLQNEPDPVVRERLGRIFGPFDNSSVLQDEETNPTLLVLRRQTNELWRSFSDRCQYEKQEIQATGDTRDPLAQLLYDFYRDAARDYLIDKTNPPVELSFDFLSNGITLPDLSESTSVSYPLKLRLSAPPEFAKAKKTVRAILPDTTWLRVAIPASFNPDRDNVITLGTGFDFEIPLSLERKPDATSKGTVAPKGLFFEAVVNGRVFHRRVPVRLPLSDNQRLVLRFSSSPENADNPLGDLRLRPNTRQSVYVFVYNPTGQTRKVVVEVKPNNGSATVSEPVEVEAGKSKRVNFPKGAPVPPPIPGAAGVADKAPELPELSGTLRVLLLDETNKVAPPLDRQDITVGIASPREYVRVTKPPIYDPTEKRLNLKIKQLNPVVGQRADVRLVLNRKLIPGFLGSGIGTYLDSLPDSGGEVELNASEFKFEEVRPDKNGLVALTVDGYERAYLYRLTFKPDGIPLLSNEYLNTMIRVDTPKQAVPSSRSKVRLEVDNAPRDVVITLNLDKSNTKNFTRQAMREGARRERVGFVPSGPDGGLLFDTIVEDWVVEINTEGIIGQREMRIDLFDKNALLDHEHVTDKDRPMLSASAWIIFDPTKPELAQFVSVNGVDVASAGGPPSLVKWTKAIKLVAEGADRESDIDAVKFFIGKAKDDKPPEGEPINAVRDSDNPKRWKADINIQPANYGPLDLTVQVINGVGLSSVSTRRVIVNETGMDEKPKAAAAPKDEPTGPTEIKGLVTEGDRPSSKQTVYLIDKDNKVKSTAETDKDGNYLFMDVEPPGPYRVYAERPDAKRKGGSSMFKIDKGQTKTWNIAMELY